MIDPTSGQINYDLAIPLDAEKLAETGVKDTYDSEVVPKLKTYGVSPRPITEIAVSASGVYELNYANGRYPISGPGLRPKDAWGLAAYALFDIVNRQLHGSDVRLYALNGGNDLEGIFMTPAEAEKARRALPSKSDWPYLPTSEPEWFGMYHD
jgi:hypothetical protein